MSNSNESNDIIFVTCIHTDGNNLFPKPEGFADEQVDSFYDEDKRWQDTNLNIGTKNKIFFDKETIDEDGAWIICSGPIPVSEEKLMEIVSRERLSIWKPRSLMQWVEFFMD